MTTVNPDRLTELLAERDSLRAIVAAIVGKHVPTRGHGGHLSPARCTECGWPFPCETVRLARAGGQP